MTNDEFDNQPIAKGDVIVYHTTSGVRTSSLIHGADWMRRVYFIANGEVSAEQVIKYISNN